MMFPRLAQLARRELLLDDPAYAVQGVHWIVDIDARGTLLRLTPTGQPQRIREEENCQELPVPKRRPRADWQVLPNILVDEGLYVFGLGDPCGSDQRERLDACAQAMLRETIKLARVTGDLAVQAQALATARVLDTPEKLSAAWLASGDEYVDVALGGRGRIKVPRSWATHHLFAFRFEGELVAQRCAVRHWLAGQTAPPAAVSLAMTCA